MIRRAARFVWDWTVAMLVVFALLFALTVIQAIADPEPPRDTVEVQR